MNLWQKITHIGDACSAGKQLENSVVWKKMGVAVSALSALLAALLPFIDGLEHVDPEIIDSISRGIWGIVGLYNTYTHIATTKTIGL